MRENKNLTLIMFVLSAFSFIVALLFNYYITETFVVNVALAVFGSSLLAALVALITYFANKKAVLKSQGDILVKLLNLFSKYKFNQNKTTNTARENLEILADARNVVFVELSAKRWEYCPFFKESKQDKFLFSSVQYFVDFFNSISHEISILDCMQDIGFNNKPAQESIAKIENLIYIKTKETLNAQGEISAQEYENIIKEDLSAYLNEYVQVINGKHKGKYRLINQPITSKGEKGKVMSKKLTTKTIYKIIFALLFIGVSLYLILNKQYEVFVSTVVIGALVGLFTSYTISDIFEKEKEKNKQEIRTATLNSFISSCSVFLIAMEDWYKEYAKTYDYCILKNPEIVDNKIKEVRDDFRKHPTNTISDEYKVLISEYIYSVHPIYHAQSELNNQQLLLSEILTVEQYNYFNSYIYNDIIKHYSEMKKKDPYADETNREYIFTQLHICFGRVNEALKLFPEIEKTYNARRKK